MKVLALGVLLVSLYCIEGAVVKREAEGEEPATEVPAISQYLPGLAELFKKDTFTEYAAQTQAFIQQLHDRFLSEQERIGQAFSTWLESAKKVIQ